MSTRKCTYRHEKKNWKKKVRGIEKLIEYQKGFWDELVTSDKNSIT